MNKGKYLILILLLLGFCGSCRTAKPHKIGEQFKKSSSHILKLKRSQPRDSAIVVIHAQFKNLYDRIKYYKIKVNGKHIYNDKNGDGHITLTLAPGNYKFKALKIGFDPDTTATIFINTGDSIRIDFYLKSIKIGLY